MKEAIRRKAFVFSFLLVFAGLTACPNELVERIYSC